MQGKLLEPLNQIILQTFIAEYTLYDRHKKVHTTAIYEFILQTESGFYGYQWEGGKFTLNFAENRYENETDLAFTYDRHTPFFSNQTTVFEGFENLPCELTGIEYIENGLCFIANGYDKLYLNVQPHNRFADEHFSDKQFILNK